MIILVFWILCAIAAAIASSAREKSAGIGFLLGFLLGPIGLVIVLVGDNPRRERERAEDRALLLSQARSGQQQAPGAIPPPPRPCPTGQLWIARSGIDLGQIEIARVRAMLASGSLRRDDVFLDWQCGEWVPLDLHPGLAVSGT